MEPNPKTAPGMAPGGPSGPSASMGGGGNGFRSSPEQRERWRRKSRIKANRKAAREGKPLPYPELGLGGPGTAPSASGPGDGPAPSPILDDGGGAGGAAPGEPSAVPWDADTVRPLTDELIPQIERVLVDQLAARAAKVDPALVTEVRRDAAWGKGTKVVLGTSLPAVAAKWLNRTGVGAENAPEVALGIAITGIAAGHLSLMARLDALAARRSGRPAGPVSEPSPEASDAPAGQPEAAG